MTSISPSVFAALALLTTLVFAPSMGCAAQPHPLAPLIAPPSAEGAAPAAPDPADAVVPYAYELEAAQPFQPPFLARFRKGDANLTFIAARHGCDPATYRLIDEALASRPHAFVLIEGVPLAMGVNPARYAKRFEEWSAGAFCRGGGEPAYVASKALARGGSFSGVEPDEHDVARAVLARGYTAEDLLGFYFVRQIPQYREEGVLAAKGVDECFHMLVPKMGQRTGLETSAAGFTLDRFRAWYEAKQGKPFDAENMDSEEPAPLATGKLFTQRLSAVVGLVRDRHIANLIAQRLLTEKDALVVLGGSHYTTLRPALEALLGRPVELHPDAPR